MHDTDQIQCFTGLMTAQARDESGHALDASGPIHFCVKDLYWANGTGRAFSRDF